MCADASESAISCCTACVSALVCTTCADGTVLVGDTCMTTDGVRRLEADADATATASAWTE